MKEKVKHVLTVVLLLFAGVTLAVQIAKEFKPVKSFLVKSITNIPKRTISPTNTRSQPPHYLTDEELDRKLGVDIEAKTPVQFVWVVYFHRVQVAIHVS